MKIEDVVCGWIDEIGRIGVFYFFVIWGFGMDDGLWILCFIIVVRVVLYDGIGVRCIVGVFWM